MRSVRGVRFPNYKKCSGGAAIGRAEARATIARMGFEILHQRALTAANQVHRSEVELVGILQQIDHCKGFKEMGFASLFVYATEALGLSEECAFKVIRVERKAFEVPQLKAALESGKFTLSKAVVISSVINPENQAHWLDMARTRTKRELEKLVAEAHPERPKPEKFREQGNGMVRLELSVTEEVFELLQRSQELLAQKRGEHPSMAEVLGALAVSYVKREDPVAKAARNAHKTVPGDSSSQRHHHVHLRDRGRCQYKLPSGKICGQRRWLHVHHLKPRAHGGTDEPDNLVTLCSAHHRMVHETEGPYH
jgi:hypothetical protein